MLSHHLLKSPPKCLNVCPEVNKANNHCMVNLQDSLVEAEEKYRKAMVSNAQLDNEKSNLMYQVDTLRDTLMELEELLYETRRECEEKTKVRQAAFFKII